MEAEGSRSTRRVVFLGIFQMATRCFPCRSLHLKTLEAAESRSMLLEIVRRMRRRVWRPSLRRMVEVE